MALCWSYLIWSKPTRWQHIIKTEPGFSFHVFDLYHVVADIYFYQNRSVIIKMLYQLLSEEHQQHAHKTIHSLPCIAFASATSWFCMEIYCSLRRFLLYEAWFGCHKKIFILNLRWRVSHSEMTAWSLHKANRSQCLCDIVWSYVTMPFYLYASFSV